jgi:aminoglycoside N3'-acetyltransferase
MEIVIAMVKSSGNNKCVQVASILSSIQNLLTEKVDTFVLHSSILGIGIPCEGIDVLRDSLVSELVEDLGKTIIVPTFSFSVNKDWKPDVISNDCGALSKSFIRKFADHRTIHPLHSVIILGPDYRNNRHEALEREPCPSSFGPSSIWREIAQREGIINIGLGIGLYGGATFLHAYEEFFQVPYRAYIPLDPLRISAPYRSHNFTYYARTPSVDTGEYLTLENDWDKILGDLKLNRLYSEYHDPFVISFSHTGAVYKFIRRVIKLDPFYFVKK